MNLKSIAITNVGKVRQNNEDNFYLCGQYKSDVDMKNMSCYYDESRANYLFSVCDGMGGEAFGELASLIATRLLDSYTEDFRHNIDQYTEKANGEICAEIVSHGGKRIGTTFAVLEISDGYAYAFNIGDSRIYHIRKGTIRQLSSDHTQIQMLINQGFVSPEDAKSHPARHVLTQHLGIFPDEMLIEPYIAESLKIEEGDIFLLCSDGLTDALSDNDILEIVINGSGIEQRASKLVEEALNNGSRDNVTVLLVKVSDNSAQSMPKKTKVDRQLLQKILKKHSKSHNDDLINEILGIIDARTSNK